ncbi:MAG: hypothetical protein IJD64_02030 [Clostridia bacterium]|nr:hypothetical protein [Clostridia bacterium]
MKKLRIIALALAILCLLAPLTQVVSAAEISTLSEETVNSLDFSSYDNTALHASLSPSDLLTVILQRIVGDERVLSDAEKKYLDRYFDEYLIYDATLPPSLLSTETTESGLKVKAKSYSYQAKNGETVMYFPVRVTMGSMAKPLSYSSDEQCFVAEWENASEFSSLTVYYSGSITLPKEKINRLLTMAFNDATNALLTEDEMLKYTAALQEYQNYLRAVEQYEADCLTYDAYLSSLELYEKAVEEYQKNQEEWKIYHQKYELYEAYCNDLRIYEQKMTQYNADYKKHLAQIDAHKAYLVNLSTIRTSLVPMESLFLSPSDGKTGTLYRALQNNELVTMFEKYQNVLPKKPIEGMREEAERLNTLLGEYAEERKISEKKAFESYQKNYDEICYLFNSLYGRMSSIFEPPKGAEQSAMYTLMCSKLDIEYGAEEASYKKWRIKNVLAHLYLICLCLDDTKTPEATWNFYADDGKKHTYYYSNLLAQNLIISDVNAADPSSLTWIDEVLVSEAPTMPEKPIEVIAPTPPMVMEEPKAPTAMEQPLPPPVIEAPNPPSESDHSLVLRTGEICLALQQGLLYERSELTEAPTITLPEISIEKRTLGVSIYGARGCLLETDEPSSLPIPSESSEDLPISFEEGFNIYTFNGWSTSQDQSSISAIYQRAPKTYRATFVIDGQTVYETQVPIAQTPRFEGSAAKESTETVDYIFQTWDPPLSPIHEDTVYVAKYREQTRKYTVSFSILNQSLSHRYEWQQMPNVPTVSPKYYYSGATLFEFDGWDKEITPVTQNTTYTAQYRELVLAALPDGSDGTLSVAPTSQGYLLVTSEDRVTSISALVAKAVSENCRLDVLFSERNVTLSMDTIALQALQNAHMNELFIDRSDAHGTAIHFFDTDNKEILLSRGELRLSLPYSFGADANVYLSSYDPFLQATQATVSCTPTASTVELIASSGIYYRPYERFTLTLNVGKNGQAMANESIYSEGEKVYLTIHPNAHYRISALFLKNPVTGEITELSQKNYTVMPAYNAILCVEFSPIEYTVKFVYHGETKIEKHPFGATLVFPEIPSSFEEDGFFYTFLGWSETASVVTGDATYTANYYSVRVEDVADDGEGGAWNAVIWNILAPLAIFALLLLGILIAVPIIIVKQVKKKKKQTNNQNE